MISFKNKKILVTGATGGIGREIVKKFISLGGNVLGTGTNLERLELLKKDFPDINVVKFDISEHSKIEEFIDNASTQLTGLDILVNNAGTNMDNLSLRMKYEEWKRVIDINLNSTFLISKFAIKKMLKNKYGRIVNITSVVGVTGGPGQVNYSSSKAGLIGMTKSLSQELASRNITVNCIAPGFIDTPMTSDLDENRKAKVLSSIPANRFGSPEDLSTSILFLASEESSYITGQTIHINGGLYMN